MFLDRDGVINMNHGYVHTPECTDWLPGIFEFVHKAIDAGYLPIIVTNQAGIARGLYTEDEFIAYTKWMHGVFETHDAPIVATYYCPHHPEVGGDRYRVACECRKPAPGMIRAALEDFRLDAMRSHLVGDKTTDIAAAGAAGVNGILLPDAKFPDWAGVWRSIEEREDSYVP